MLACVQNKYQEFPSCLTPFFFSSQSRPRIWKEGFSDNFQISRKILPVMHIFSFTIMNCLKRFIGIKTISSRIISYDYTLSFCIPPLTKRQLTLSEWFGLTIAGFYPLYKENEGWNSVELLKK